MPEQLFVIQEHKAGKWRAIDMWCFENIARAEEVLARVQVLFPHRFRLVCYEQKRVLKENACQSS